MDYQLLLFRINRSKPAKYSLSLLGTLLFFLFFKKLLWNDNNLLSTSSSNNSNSFGGISTSGNDLTNSEINSLIANSNILTKQEKHEFELKSPYLNNEVSEQNYLFSGDVMIRNDQYVRLTQDKKHQHSSFFSNNKLNARSFVMETKFALGGNGDVSQLHGDGFAIFFTTEQLSEGELFAVNEYYNGFGIYIDTYRNGRSGVFPYVMAAKNDGTIPYDKDRDGKNNEISGCIARSLWKPIGGYTKMRLIYINDGYLSVDFDYKNTGEWTNCFSLQDIVLPESFHIGFSANTGDLSETVDIIENHVDLLFDYKGEPVMEFQKLLETLEDPNSPDKFEDVSEEFLADDKTKRRRLVTKKKDGKPIRRTIRRLQNAEKRIKKEAEQRRAERREIRKKWWASIKKYVYGFLVLVALYLATIVYRVHRKNTLRNNRSYGIIA